MKHDEPVTLPLPLVRARRACREAIIAFGWKVVEEGEEHLIGLKPLSWTNPWMFRVDLRPIGRGDQTSASIKAEHEGGFDLFGMFSRPVRNLKDAMMRRAQATQMGASGNFGPNQIFISYRRADSADVTGRLDDALIARFGREVVFKDLDSIPHGEDFVSRVTEAIEGAKVVLAVLGPDWVSATDSSGARRLDDPNDLVRVEIETALRLHLPVIPVLVRGANLPAEAELPASLWPLRLRNGTPVRSDPDFRGDVDDLAASLEALVVPPPDPAAPSDSSSELATLDAAESYLSRWQRRGALITFALMLISIAVHLLGGH
jgi:hypothetical protein